MESKLKGAKPKINFTTALEDVTGWATTINRAVSDDVKIRNENLSLERELQLVKILLDHLHGEATVLGFIRFEIEKGGRPTSIQQFSDKLMSAGLMLQQAQYVINMCGFRWIPKRKPDDPEDEPEGGNPYKKQRHVNGKNTRPTPHDANNGAGAGTTAELCNGCGRKHRGECRMKSHPDYNNSNLPWHESASGKAYFGRGLTCLPSEPPFLQPNSSWEKPAEWSKDQSGSRSFQGGRSRTDRGRGGRGGRGITLSALSKAQTRKVLMRPVFVVLSHNRREVQALIDTGSPADYISPAFAAWLQREGHEKTPHVECVCSPLQPDACVCSTHLINFNITQQKSSEDTIPLAAAIMPLASYDIIIGYPSIEKFNLLDSLRRPIPGLERSLLAPNLDISTDLVKEFTNALEHTFLGAILKENLGSTFPHISDFLDGSGEDGDDLSELFASSSPWESDNINEPSNDLIDFIEMQGSTASKTKCGIFVTNANTISLLT